MPEPWETEVDDALRAMVADTPAIDTMARERGRQRLATAITGKGSSMTITEERTIHPTPAHRRRTRWLAAAAAAVAITGGGVVAVQTIGTDGGGSRPPSVDLASAAQLLTRAASNVPADKPLKPGQFRYVDHHDWTTTTEFISENKALVWLEEHRTETWVPADHTDTWQQRSSTTGKYKWLTGSDEEAEKLGVSLPEPHSNTRTADCGDFNAEPGVDMCSLQEWSHPMPEWIAGLPRDPEKLLKRLREDSKPAEEHTDAEVDGYALKTATQSLGTGLLPADVRKALYKAIALMPGIKVTESQADLDGRKGTALGLDLDDEGSEIVVNLNTGEFLGRRDVARIGPNAGEVVDHTAVHIAVVDKIGQRPPK